MTKNTNISMLEVFKFKLHIIVSWQRYQPLCFAKLSNQIIIWIKTNLYNNSIRFNCQFRYYVSLKDEFGKNFLPPKIKIVGINIKR